uniref:Uncharacterized protein n=1 Tax=Anabas testudineus TaxID=64144 RepID=A0A3Q1HMN8_ANATE
MSLHLAKKFRQQTNYGDSLNPQLYNQAWMQSIPNETLLSAITIPGTHESLSLHGGPLAVCQVWTLDQQLKVGLRYFDIHTGIWIYTQKHIILNFLNEHSSETVLLKVTVHWFHKDKVKTMINELIEQHKDKIWTKSSVPTLQQARGKIILLQSETFTAGAENHKSFFLMKNMLLHVEKKIKRIKSVLCNESIILTDSAASVFSSPRSLAKRFNTQLYDFLNQHKDTSLNQGCLGIFSMNFPGVDLIKSITDM